MKTKMKLLFAALFSAIILAATPLTALNVNDNLTLATPAAIGNQAASGVLPIDVNIASSWIVNQSTAGLSFTFAAPTNPRAGLLQSITNGGSAPFTIYGVQIGIGQSASFKWSGVAWTAETAAKQAEIVTGVVSPVGAPPLGAKEYLRTDSSMTTHAVNAAGTAWQALPRGLQKQQTLTGGGTVSWNANTLSFTNRFITIGAGRGIDNISSSGYYDINMPAVGTVITGVCGAPNQTVTAAGIPFTGGSSWHVLWYYLPTGAFNSSPTNFRMSGYTADCLIPDNAVMVAAWNTDDNKLRLGTGEVLQPNSTNQPYIEREATRRLFAGQNWLSDATKRTYWGAGTQSYDVANRRVVLNGANSAAGLKTRLPYRWDANYSIEAKISKLGGAGTTYIGFVGVDASGNQGSVTAWQVANAVAQPAGNTTTFAWSGLGNTLAIPATSQYVDVIVLGNYTGSGDSAIDYLDFKIDEKQTANLAGSMINATDIAFYNNNAIVTGALVIKTNISDASVTMFDMRLEGYDYSAVGSWDFQMGGYIYTTTGAWYNHSFQGLNRRGLNVRYGIDGGKVVAIVGDVTTVWNYPKMRVAAAMVGHSGAAAAQLKGWTIDIRPALTGITGIAALTLINNTPTYASIAAANADATLLPNANFRVGNQVYVK